MKLRHLMFFLLLIAFAASGCIFSPDDDNGDDNPTPPVTCKTADDADDAMEIFREVYSGRQLDCYRKLLSEDYLFIERNGDITNFDTEMVIAEKMFLGIAGQNNFIIADISIDVLDPQGVWTDTPENDPDFGGFPESRYRTYIVHMEFVIQGENLTLLVDGPVTYFVMNEGGDSADFKILGMRDLTHGDS